MRQNDSMCYGVDSKLFLTRPGCCFQDGKMPDAAPLPAQLILKVINIEIMEQRAIAAILSSESLFFAIFHAI